MHGRGEALDEGGIDAAPAPLVGARRIGEAVADHPLAARERRTYEVLEVQRAGSEHEQRFGDRRQRFRARLEDDLADSFGKRGAARLACQARRDRVPPEPGAGELRRRRLPGALDPLERNEFPPTHGWAAPALGVAARAWARSRSR